MGWAPGKSGAQHLWAFTSLEGVVCGAVTKKAGQIAHIAALEGYKRRANRQQLTGEWIVYYVHNGQNYYLDIAFHDEASTPEGEQALYNRLALACQWEFPFAFDS